MTCQNIIGSWRNHFRITNIRLKPKRRSPTVFYRLMNRSCLRLLGFEVFVAHINSNSCGVEVCVLFLNPLWKMAESMSMGASIRKWVVENKLRSVGTFLVAFYLFIYFLQFSVKTENPFGFGFSFGFCFWFCLIWWNLEKDVYGLAESGVQLPTTGLNPVWRPASRSSTLGMVFFIFIFSAFSIFCVCLHSYGLLWSYVDQKHPLFVSREKMGKESDWTTKPFCFFVFFLKKFQLLMLANLTSRRQRWLSARHLKMKF